MDMNAPEIERVDCESSMNKKTRYASKTRDSTSAGSSWESDDVPSKKPSATVEISAEDVSNRSIYVQEG